MSNAGDGENWVKLLHKYLIGTIERFYFEVYEVGKGLMSLAPFYNNEYDVDLTCNLSLLSVRSLSTVEERRWLCSSFILSL